MSDIEHGPFDGFRIDVERLSAGQPRPYADSVYECELRFTNWWTSTTGPRKGNWEPDEQLVREAVRLFVHPFKDEPTWADDKLKTLEKTGPATWRAVVISPYLD